MHHRLTDLDGVANLNKPAGWSSAKAVTAVRAVLGGRDRRVGHAGTLDPRASGVLVLLLGRATRLSELLMDAGKEYVAVVRLGATSSTEDTEGQIVQTPDVSPVGPETVRDVLPQFRGWIDQRPPAFSAVKIDGKRAYKLARRGREFLPAARKVRIDEIELSGYDWPDATMRIVCGRGTYIRSLARDIGEAIGVGGYLYSLMRTRVGPFRIEQAVAVEHCRLDNIERWLLPPERAVGHLPPGRVVRLDQVQTELIGRGITLEAARVIGLAGEGLEPSDPVAALDSAGRLLAICRLAGCGLEPVHVLRPLFGPLPR